MAKPIIWNKRAIAQLNHIIAYLESDWNETVTRNFVVRTYQLVELLSDFPDMGTLENSERQIRALVITKHNILFYTYTDSKITVLSIFDTRQHPSKRKY